jgi:hypothetical protein
MDGKPVTSAAELTERLAANGTEAHEIGFLRGTRLGKTHVRFTG